ncbi:MAG: hypothetical protein DDT26_00754 [Dehalococcoidia bacterium]|nr:hypothetical protein [Chloroflexota bacterium]
MTAEVNGQVVKTYEGNPQIRVAGQKIGVTAYQLGELKKCAADFNYFAENYCKVLSLGAGLVNFKMRGYQQRIAENIRDNRFNIVLLCRQSGKTTLVSAMLCWEVLFKRDWTIAVLANKSDQAREVMGRIQLMYENLPFWMQKGAKVWNKGSFSLENNSRIFSSGTSASGIRGRSVDHLYLDEFAHIDRNKQEPFYTSTYPVISAGANTKLTITSTPKGLELFYKIWTDATQLPDGTKIDANKNIGVCGENGFVASEAHWSEVPGRDEAWKDMTLSQMSQEEFNQEFENHFIGSSGTLIAGHVLRRLVHQKPITENGSLRVFESAKQDHLYIALIDVARGMGLDYNTCVVVDATQIPFRVVCTYRNNLKSTLQFPSVVAGIAKEYNNAATLVETNDIGQQVADALHYDLDCENVLMTTSNGRKGTSVSSGYGAYGSNLRRGLKMSAAVKRIGCAQLKNLIELDKLIVNDINILDELFTFVENGTSYSADTGAHDDLVMPLVMFGWLANQRYFKELTNGDIRAHVASEDAANVEADLMPFGFIRNGIGDGDESQYHHHHDAYLPPAFF